MTQPHGLRERKRRQTRSRIVDSATSLVEKHGFDNVTIEEICADAEISKRTFFNYMESKDEAVLGTLPVAFDEDRLAHFVDTPSENLVLSALGELATLMSELHEGDDDEFRARINQRRRNIIGAEPSLALISFTRYRELAAHLHDAISGHLEKHPGDRRLTGLSDDEEATALVSLIRESLFFSNARSVHSCPSTDDLLELWIDSARQLTTLSKGLHW